MADKTYKVDEVVDLGYQAPNKETGAMVIAEIYLPNKAKDSNFPDVTLVEIGTSGTYRGTFTPDAEGTWQVVMHKDDGDGQVVRNYSVGSHNVHSVGDAVAAVGSEVADVDTHLDTVEGKIEDIQNQVGALDTPPLAF